VPPFDYLRTEKIPNLQLLLEEEKIARQFEMPI